MSVNLASRTMPKNPVASRRSRTRSRSGTSSTRAACRRCVFTGYLMPLKMISPVEVRVRLVRQRDVVEAELVLLAGPEHEAELVRRLLLDAEVGLDVDVGARDAQRLAGDHDIGRRVPQVEGELDVVRLAHGVVRRCRSCPPAAAGTGPRPERPARRQRQRPGTGWQDARRLALGSWTHSSATPRASHVTALIGANRVPAAAGLHGIAQRRHGIDGPARAGSAGPDASSMLEPP